MNSNNNSNNIAVKLEKKKNNDCNWCAESQLELQNSYQEIERLQTRISKLKEGLDCCKTHGHAQDDDNNTTSKSPLIIIKVETPDEEEEILSRSAPIKPNPKEFQQHLNIKQELQEEEEEMTLTAEEGELKIEPMSQDETEEEDETPCSSMQQSSVKTDDVDFTYKCIQEFNCSRVFISLLEISEHLADVHGWETYAPFCEICGLHFMTVRAMKSHLRGQHPSTCQLCHEEFQAYGDFVLHLRQVHGTTPAARPCSECGQVFSKPALIKHIKDTHGAATAGGKQLIWPCTHCKAIFLNAGEKDDHETHQHRIECRTCGEFFTSFEVVTQHRITDHGHTPPTPKFHKKLEKKKRKFK